LAAHDMKASQSCRTMRLRLSFRVRGGLQVGRTRRTDATSPQQAAERVAGIPLRLEGTRMQLRAIATWTEAGRGWEAFYAQSRRSPYRQPRPTPRHRHRALSRQRRTSAARRLGDDRSAGSKPPGCLCFRSRPVTPVDHTSGRGVSEYYPRIPERVNDFDTSGVVI